ncbi:hypothetical protein GA0116948_11915 [Chitinophaga costaii]|uniref:Uncharacterized protein n=1 Tax=Chitinophaga costaii TaxID=1335309 RepID=A0A1C4G097_9BACT|nr:hypothetical protein GA0116948_11915 [Chitinophaga costaii]
MFLYYVKVPVMNDFGRRDGNLSINEKMGRREKWLAIKL